MTDVEATTAELLAEKSDLEDGLEDLLDVDAAAETWTFEDVPLDSGTFGELVSRGVVEKRDGEYSLADREAVRRALGVEQEADEGTARTSPANRSEGIFEDVSLPDLRVQRPVATLGLVGALALVVLFRVLPWPAVFRGEDVVLSGNDPYAYRYIVHQIVEASAGPLDFSVFSSLPGGMEHGEPLMVAMLSWVSMLLGGTSAVGGVLAWFPVVSAVVTALLVYVLAVRVTEDRRIGIAAVALLAIMPGHAFRTGLGFADHHAFDYPWLALTALAVVSLVGRDERDWRTWAWGLALGVGVAGQTLAWDAGPLLLVPLGLFVVGAVPSWVRAGRSPGREGMAFVGGLGLASVLVFAVHVGWGWHSSVVALAPVLLVGGSVVLVGLGEAARRFEVSARSLLGGEVLVGGIGFAAVWTLFPDFASELGRGVDFLVSTEGIAETTSIFSGDLGSIIGPIFLFGFALFLALPYMGWALWRSSREFVPTWLIVGVYGWWFLLLSVIQIRFAGQLALFTAVFGGLGFVHVAAWVDLATYPRPFSDGVGESEERRLSSGEDVKETEDLEWPERRQALSLMGLGLGVGSLGILNTPIKHSQLLVDESLYEAATFMREYADERGWEYPENYVFSEWGRNRVYNWFVNGESRGYGYAQSNFEEFVTATDSEQWYGQLRDRVGFVVTEAGQSNGDNGNTIYDQLWGENFGVETGRYRAVWQASDESRRVYTLVPGAIVTGRAESGQMASIRAEFTVNESTHTYERTEETITNGWYGMHVSNPGIYTIGTNEVTVSEADVLENRIAGDRGGTAHWQLDEGEGPVAFDTVGGNHGRIFNGSWTDGRNGRAFEATGDSYIQVPHHEAISGSDGFTVTAWVRTDPDVDYREKKKYPRIVAKANSGYKNADGYLLTLWRGRLYGFLGNGESWVRLGTEYIDDAEWHHVGLSYDGSQSRLFLDGDEIGRGEITVSIATESPFAIGSTSYGSNRFVGQIDDVRMWSKAIDIDERM